MRAAINVLQQAGVSSPQYDARELLEYARAHASDVPRTAAGAQLRDELQKDASQADTECDVRHLFAELIRRRSAREPLQHILGTMYFRYLELESRPGVFITRPETELVAEAGMNAISDTSHARVLDLCSGSGAIAISIATEMPGTSVWAIEKSDVAHASAQRNIAKYQANVHLIHGDVFEAERLLTQEANRPHSPRWPAHSFDLVTSNPPYVPMNELLSPEVQADPPEALFGGGDAGLDLPLALIPLAARLTAPAGTFVMEHAEHQAQALRDAAREYFHEVDTGYDYTSRPRWLLARRPTIA
ncbi:MAG: peptide chain release factor N(5)-glutamine methyltransferase [Actinomycetaceae bacterium]|nr:peptide chain release factor N(5)-glutamine methyltransferase [Actinomycetaceae bacterium]